MDYEATDTSRENREYKDSVFVDLFFSDCTAYDNELSLFNALHDTNYARDSIQIDRIKVEQILYMNFKNDISFHVQNKFMLFAEHQSTVNPNMCLRALLYSGRAYEQIVPVRKRYSKKLAQIPAPEFYVFYNGIEDYPLEQVLKLSDSYKIKGEDAALELKVKIININPEKKHPILEKCPVLREYFLFVECVRNHRNNGEPDPIRKAIAQCMEQNILKEYLDRKASEVRNMLIAEYDYKTDIEVQREEAMEDGIEKGLLLGKISLCCRKLARGDSLEAIADALETEPQEIADIIAAAKECAPDYDVEMIYRMLQERH